MSRPFKLNDTPTAPFSLREMGPMKLTDISKRLGGATYRTARGAKPDGRATVDPTPCPNCGSLVEWCTTGKRGPKGETVRYAYARCRGHKQHRWSFHGESENLPDVAALPTFEPGTAFMPVQAPPPRSSGAAVMGEWIAQRIAVLDAELSKLRTIEQLAQEVTGRTLTAPVRAATPKGDVEPNGTPPGAQRSAHTVQHRS